MNFTTKTGLIASPRKRVIRFKRTIDLKTLAPCAITRQAPFSLRPFAGLYNPYSKGCSVLCNHPASSEAKSVVKKAKDAWAIEGKQIHGRDKSPNRNEAYTFQESDLPEEFFRRYTDTDSRPLTPTPTVISGRTRASVGSHFNRRCVTPEPQTTTGKERKQLILDLRRSHSQETLYWNASSELSPSQVPEATTSWLQQTQSPQHQTKNVEVHDTLERTSTSPSNNIRTDAMDIIVRPESTSICINARDDGEEDPPRRRGKKKKKSKQAPMTISFQPNQDPETQIATLPPDSLNPSGRPSLIPNGLQVPIPINQPPRSNIDISDTLNRSFFLDEDSLKVLRLGLNINTVEAVFDRYKHRALKETLRITTDEALTYESKAVKDLKEQLNLPEVDYQKWLTLPRKYSRSSCRFELPIDSMELTEMTPMQYLSKHVVILKDIKQLYQRIFEKHLPVVETNKKDISDSEDESPPEAENELNINMQINKQADIIRTLPLSVLTDALQDVLGFHGTVERINEIRKVLCFQLEGDNFELNFRTWCGVVAFCERYLASIDKREDPCNEIEIADFESLDRRLRISNANIKIRRILTIIKNN